MIQALAALLGASLTAAACYAAGALLIDRLNLRLRRSERLPLAFVLGAACLHLAIFAILSLHIAYWPVLVALLCGVLAIAARRGSWGLKGDREPPLNKSQKRLFFSLFGVFSLLYFLHALAPESSPDGAAYHLGLVARFLRHRGFEAITTNMYAGLSEGVEMLYVPAFAIGRHSAGALVHFAFTIALALAILAYGRRLGKPWVGVGGALLTYASPIVGIDGSSAYNDVAVGAIVFSVFYWLQIWDESRDNGALVPVGLLAGYAYAAKYTAFIMLPFALGFILWRARRLRPLIPVTSLAFLMIAPWMIKDWIILQNPIAPFGNQIFRNANFHVISEQQYAAYYRRYDLPDLRRLPIEVTVRGGRTQGILGAAFLAAPLALLALRQRAGRRLLAAGAVLLIPYFGNIGTRFLIPLLPFVSLSMALALSSAPAVLALLIVLHAVTSWPSGSKMYASPSAWTLDGVLFKEAFRIIPQYQYLSTHYAPYDVARMIEANVPKGERVLAFSGVWDAYTSREVLVSFQGAFNETVADSLTMGWIEGRQPRVLETFSFPERTVRRLRVVQTAAPVPRQQWGIHELRFYDHGVELPHTPEWHLSAWPNPWDVRLAFDNSEATRWRSWEAAAPGMYIDVDLGKAQAMDEVQIETSYEFKRIRLKLEEMYEDRQWENIPGDPKISFREPSGNIRLAATSEMNNRGIHYLLVSDSDFGASDFRENSEAWGLMLVAQGYGARLYRVSGK